LRLDLTTARRRDGFHSALASRATADPGSRPMMCFRRAGAMAIWPSRVCARRHTEPYRDSLPASAEDLDAEDGLTLSLPATFSVQ
jgi:hypothetical protein